MKIAVDADGVVCRFDAYTLETVNRELGTLYTLKDWTSPKVEEIFTHPEFPELFQRILVSPDTWAILKAYPGVIKDLKNLKKKHDLLMITQLPNEICRDVRYKWMCRRGIEMPVYSVEYADRKVELALQLGVEVMVEDRARTANLMAEAGITSYLINRNWNQVPLHPDVKRVTWRQFVALTSSS